MKIAIAGNCQMGPLRDWLRQSFNEIQIHLLTPYHMIQSQAEVDTWNESLTTVDYILMMPVSNGYGSWSNIGTDEVKLKHENKLFTYVNLYSDIFFPFWGYAKDNDSKTITFKRFPET